MCENSEFDRVSKFSLRFQQFENQHRWRSPSKTIEKTILRLLDRALAHEPFSADIDLGNQTIQLGPCKAYRMPGAYRGP